MNRIASRRPQVSEYTADYHQQLIEQVEGECVLRVLENQLFWLCELASHLSTEQIDKIHAPYGWTIRQVFEHCADAERVFGYRMLRLAAGDETALPGWNENEYAKSRFGLGNFGSLVSEIGALRQANLLLLRRMSPTDGWSRRGGWRQSHRQGIAWIAAGHLQHHLSIVEKRCRVVVARSMDESGS